MEQELQRMLGEQTLNPSKFVKLAFRWGKGDLERESGARDWQQKVLDYIGEHLKNPATRHTPCRIAVASGHGIGKSALISFIIAWAQSTMEDCRIVVTAGTGPQLATKTVPEVTKWFHRLI